MRNHIFLFVYWLRTYFYGYSLPKYSWQYQKQQQYHRQQQKHLQIEMQNRTHTHKHTPNIFYCLSISVSHSKIVYLYSFAPETCAKKKNNTTQSYSHQFKIVTLRNFLCVLYCVKWILTLQLCELNWIEGNIFVFVFWLLERTPDAKDYQFCRCYT